MATSATTEASPVERRPEAHDVDNGVDFERQLGKVLPVGLPAFVLIAAVVVGFVYDLGSALLVLAGGALLATIALLWGSLRTLSGDAPISLDEAVALGNEAANEDEQKRAILQAIKDLDYEFSVGKIGEADYQELRKRYRAEAKRLLRALDRDLEPSRKRAEAYLAARLSGQSDAVLVGRASATGRECGDCGVGNDDDARFCKGCGAGLVARREGGTDGAA